MNAQSRSRPGYNEEVAKEYFGRQMKEFVAKYGIVKVMAANALVKCWLTASEVQSELKKSGKGELGKEMDDHLRDAVCDLVAIVCTTNNWDGGEFQQLADSIYNMSKEAHAEGRMAG